eukprot:1770487-Prorocentrum_lima.AAC.1
MTSSLVGSEMCIRDRRTIFYICILGRAMGGAHAAACASPCLTLVQEVPTDAYRVRASCDIGRDAGGGRSG